MALPSLNLAEPVVDAMVTLLETNLNTVIAELNATITDSYKVPAVARVLPFVPPPSVVVGELPIVGIQEIDAEFEDDTQFSLDARHNYAVVAILQNVDHQALAMQLRRMMQAIAYTIQADRVLGTAAGQGGIMRNQGGVWSVNFIRTEPGPLLADLDPSNADAPPRTYLSWTGLILNSGRTEI